METGDNVVLVYKTSVTQRSLSEEIKREIMGYQSVTACSFDLEDCDRILRVEGSQEIGEKVIELLNQRGLFCEELT